MNRTGAVVVAVVVVVFLGIGAYLLFGQPRPAARNLTFDIEVAGSTMKPTDTLQARQGDTITMNVKTDKEEEIHLHGYDIRFEGGPGKTATHTFKADKSGSFEIEIEDSSTHLGSLEVKP